MNLLQDALQYAKLGYSIVPVTPGEKAPPLVDWQAYQDTPANATQIRAWWNKTPTANIAIVTGRISGLTVIDLDGAKGRESFRTSLDNQLPSTLVHRTPRGAHMLFRYCEDLKQTTAILPGVDVRNDGGYIIAPPSIVKGKPYEVLRERETATITALPPSLNGEKPAAKDSAEIGDAPKWVSTALSGVSIEHRNDTAARLIGYFHHKGLPPDIIQATMELFAERCDPPMDIAELHRTIESVTRYQVLAQEQRIITPPLLTRDGDAYIYTWADQQITLHLEGVYRQKDGLHGTLNIDTTMMGVPSHIHGPVNWGLFSTSGRNSLVSYLKKRIETIDWPSLLEEAARLTSGLESEGEPVVILSEVPHIPTTPHLLNPLVKESETTILFGDGGTGKSTIALAAMLALHTGDPVGPLFPQQQRRGLYIDWEAEAGTHRARLEALSNGMGLIDHMPDISYLRCHMGLHDHTRQIKAALSRTGATFLVIDSAGPACAGEPEKAEAAIRFFNALRSLKVTALVTAHVTKEESKGKPFGSVFFHNLSRSTFEVIQQNDNPDGEINLGVYQRKANNSRLAKPFGLNFVYADELIHVMRADLTEFEDLAARLPVATQLAGVLRHGQKSLQDIYQALPGINQQTIRQTLHRRAEFIDQGRGFYGILARDERN